jgi:hypothetical protein
VSQFFFCRVREKKLSEKSEKNDLSKRIGEEKKIERKGNIEV